MSKMDGKSLNITQNKIEQLKILYPEIFSDEKVDSEKLKLTLGENVAVTDERYHLTWTGKSDCYRVIQEPTTDTLIPCKEESVNWDETENIFIEGENLEVLKILQKSYYGKIKMIYIDPPYNTGNDSFIYPDRFAESREEYLKRAGEMDEEGYITKEGLFRKNSKDSGRFHSNWLSMMYPRLFLARNLLKDDGVIFVSIDDHEKARLKIILDEIFGEENEIATLVWNRGHSAQAGIFKVYHEYVLVYAKNSSLISTPKSNDSELFTAGAMKRESNRHPLQKFTFPGGVRFDAIDGTNLGDSWGDIEKVRLISGEMISNDGKLANEVTLEAAFTQMNQMKEYFYGDRENLKDSRGQKIIEFFFSSKGKLKVTKERAVFTPPTVLGDYGSQGAISTYVADLFNLTESPINNPKPYKMILDFMNWFLEEDEDSIVLDFFSGSSPLAQAVIEYNLKLNNNASFICIQLGEPLKPTTEAYKAGYKTIADVGKERIRRVINKIINNKKENPDLFEDKEIDLGFRVFEQKPSNFKKWQLSNDEKQLDDQLDAFTQSQKESSVNENILIELLLKVGIELTESLETKKSNSIEYYSVSIKVKSETEKIYFLLELVNEKAIKEIIKDKPILVICLDSIFNGDDRLKTNTALQMKDADIIFQTV